MNNVLPGFIDSLPEKQEFKDRIPMERYGKSKEIAATVSYSESRGNTDIASNISYTILRAKKIPTAMNVIPTPF